jgi:hypothetical protein
LIFFDTVHFSRFPAWLASPCFIMG